MTQKEILRQLKSVKAELLHPACSLTIVKTILSNLIEAIEVDLLPKSVK